MKTTLTAYDIAHALKSDENAAWSWNGARALAEYLEEYEEGTGEELELDVVAIRCDFSEYESLQDWLKEYQGEDCLAVALERAGIDLNGDEEDEEIDDLIRSFIQDHGTLIEFDGGVIVSSF
jgi:hypothetical protein